MSKIGIKVAVGDKEFDAYAVQGPLEVTVEHTKRRMHVSVDFDFKPEDQLDVLQAFNDYMRDSMKMTDGLGGEQHAFAPPLNPVRIIGRIGEIR